MANIPAELRALPLEHIIGSPLSAAIKAQAFATQTTVDFIKEVGLKPRALESGESEDELDEVTGESGQPGFEARYVDFKFDRVLEEEVVTPHLNLGGRLLRQRSIVLYLQSLQCHFLR